MGRFDVLSATTVADLYERGFHLVESAKCLSGSMLPVDKYHEYAECFEYKQGSIANFKEVYITWVSYDSDAEDNILSVVTHRFAESGEWYVDSESLIYKHIPEKHISEYLRQQGVYTREEVNARIEERRAKMRKRA